MVELDRTEKELIFLLQQDGRMSFVDLARRLSVTEGTVRRKFNRLVEEGIIKIAAIADPFRVGFETPVVIGIRVDTAKLEEVVARICELPRIRYVAASAGEHDIIAEGYFTSNQELSEFIIEELGKIDGIRDATTSLLLRIEKQTFTWGVADYRPHPGDVQAR